MIELYIGSAFDPERVLVDVTKSIKEIYEENNRIIPSGVVLTWGNRRLRDSELTMPLNSLGTVKNGDTITFTQKLCGAK